MNKVKYSYDICLNKLTIYVHDDLDIYMSVAELTLDKNKKCTKKYLDNLAESILLDLGYVI